MMPEVVISPPEVFVKIMFSSGVPAENSSILESFRQDSAASEGVGFMKGTIMTAILITATARALNADAR